MAQTVSSRYFTAEARVRFQVGPCGVSEEQSGTGTGLSPILRFPPVSIIPSVLRHTESLSPRRPVARDLCTLGKGRCGL
jgi:hypothetical protein